MTSFDRSVVDCFGLKRAAATLEQSIIIIIMYNLLLNLRSPRDYVGSSVRPFVVLP